MKESFVKGRAVFAGIPVLIALMIACSGGESGTTLSDDGALNSFMLSDGYTACYDINGNNACDADEASAQVSNGYYEPSKLSNDGNEGAPLIAYKAGSPTHYAVNGVFSPLNTLIYSKARDAGKSYDALYEDVYEKLGSTAVQDSFLEFVGHGLDAAYRTGEEIDQIVNPTIISGCRCVIRTPLLRREICSNDARTIKQGSAAGVGKNPGVPFIDWMPVVADKSPYQISWNMWWGINGQTWKLYINNTEKCSQTFSKVSVMSAQNGTCSAELTKGPNEIYVELCNDTYCSKSAVSRILYDANAAPDAPVAVGDPVPPSMPPVYVITPPVETPQPDRGAPETPAPLPAGSAPTTGIAPAKPHIAWFAPRTLTASNTISWNIWYGTGASSATIIVTSPAGTVTESAAVSGTDMKSGSFIVSTPTDGQYTLAVKVSNAYGSSQSDEKVLTKYTENQQDPIYAPLPTGTPSQPISASLKDCALVDIGEDIRTADVNTPKGRCMTALRADNSFGGTYTAGTHDASYKPAGNKKIIAYFAEWGIYLRNYHVKDIPAARLTHLYYAFLDAKSNGDLSIIDYYAALDKSNETDTYLSPSGRKGNLKQLWLLKQKFPHLNMCFSVGGWTKSDNLYAIAASETLRNRMAESALRFAKDYKFDCIDIDWEFPVLGGEETHLASKADRDNFTKLIDALYAKLNPEGIKLTAAVSASDLGIKALNYPAFVDKLDSIILMTYDFNGAWNKYTGHQASLFPNNHPAQTYKVAYNKHWNISSALENVIKQFPDPTKAAAVRDKIMLGVAFYGRTWSGATQKPVPTQPIVQTTGPGRANMNRELIDYKQVAASTNIASESSLARSNRGLIQG
ncbi:hypothetical protein CHS0354_018433 [Potamilus streckersoni]|uniref:GH18 domain-containing protein n=1 Tax=Potamilus streckersoni TaxID=2493646 RepID=A0AAE0WA88_9BIVA|nr:hypothetical protein CHS0354_018433 [Potamilus streckersoni]